MPVGSGLRGEASIAVSRGERGWRLVYQGTAARLPKIER